MPDIIKSSVAYLALKAANKHYGKAPAALPAAELSQVQSLAQYQSELEGRVLRSMEAREAMVPQASLDAAMAEIRSRYAEDGDFIEDLARNGLDTVGFSLALERELKVDAILEKVATHAEKVSDVDVELYYLYHPDQFRRPETRLARHILITINETISDNTRVMAQQRINAIAARLENGHEKASTLYNETSHARSPLLNPLPFTGEEANERLREFHVNELNRFEEQALKHSECPTALEGGKLGDLPRGKLFSELDQALFELEAGQVSGVLESELGFHILRCDAITEACVLPQDQASTHIRKLLEQKRKREFQKAWIKQLQAG